MEPPLVQIRDGKLRGVYRESVDGDRISSFLGIPYAKPPLGDLRFKAPQPVEPWEGIREAIKDGSSCCARELTSAVKGSDDCLFLNVFTKSLKPDKLQPVMVYIHGGAFLSGSSDSNYFSPDFLLTEDVVLVTINYRLGLLGFLCLDDPSLDVHGNAGLKDQIMALRWVQNNISSFGGNPHNVTIFGESAGAGAVHYLVLSSSARGLFQKAIMQSGCVLNPWTMCRRDIVKALLSIGKQVKDDKDCLEMLSNLPPMELVELQEQILNKNVAWLKCIGPVVEKPNPTAVLTGSPYDLLKSGNYNKVPIMMGYNDQEGFLFEIEALQALIGTRKQGKSELEDLLYFSLHLDKDSKLIQDLKGRMERLYFKDEDNHFTGRVSFSTDMYFLAGLRTAAELHVATSTEPLYFYRFSANTSLNITKALTDIPFEGACHGDELGYLFKFPSNKPLEKGSVEERMIRMMVKLWTNFAKYSNPTPPNGDVAESWKAVEKDTLHCFSIDTEVKQLSHPPETERLLFWKYFDQAFFGGGYRY